MNYIRIIAMFFIIPIVIPGCAGKKNGDVSYGGTLVIAALSEINDLNPLLSIRSDSTYTGWLLYDGLVKLNEREEPVPAIAESWKISEDAREITFFLKKGVMFHDGVECTAEDVVFTFTTIKNPASDSPLRQMYDVLEDIRALDRYTVQIRLKEVCPSIFILLLKEIVPKHLLEGKDIRHNDFNNKPVGTGPFMFEKWNGNDVVLTSYEDYFEGRPYLDRIVFRVFPDKQAAWSALMQGKADVVDDLDSEDYKIIRNDHRFNGHFYYGTFCYSIIFNLRDQLLSDKRVRDAIACSINKEDIIETALGGWGIAASGPFNPSSWSYNIDVPTEEYDPVRARKIIEQLEFSLKFRLLVGDSDTNFEEVTKRLKWQLYQTGIQVDVEVLSIEKLFEERLYPGDFQTAMIPLNTSGDPDKWTSIFWHSKNSIGERRTNFSYYVNRDVDELIERGKETTDINKRKKIYRKIHAIIAEDRPALFFFFRKQVTGMSSSVKGVPEYAGSFYWSIKDWYMVNHEP